MLLLTVRTHKNFDGVTINYRQRLIKCGSKIVLTTLVSVKVFPIIVISLQLSCIGHGEYACCCLWAVGLCHALVRRWLCHWIQCSPPRRQPLGWCQALARRRLCLWIQRSPPRGQPLEWCHALARRRLCRWIQRSRPRGQPLGGARPWYEDVCVAGSSAVDHDDNHWGGATPWYEDGCVAGSSAVHHEEMGNQLIRK